MVLVHKEGLSYAFALVEDRLVHVSDFHAFVGPAMWNAHFCQGLQKFPVGQEFFDLKEK